MTYTQTERLRMLDCLLANYGSVGREMLIDWFGVSPACATRDLALYREIKPGNVYFCDETKKWHRSASFAPVVVGPVVSFGPHKFWYAGEADCPPELKAGGELHTLKCKVCGQEDPRTPTCPGPANK
jgi:hypothetical protein